MTERLKLEPGNRDAQARSEAGSDRGEKILIGAISLLLALAFLYIHSISEGIQEPEDGAVHYFISEASWDDPTLLLHHWGKPLFTLLSSPFSNAFGFAGMVLFNALLFLLASLFLSGTAGQLGLSDRWTVPCFLFLTPVYFNTAIGGMTEVLFGTVAAASLYFFSQERYAIAAIVLSFITFTRPEGMVLLPLGGLYLLWRSPVHLPFLLTGFLIYGLAGWPHYGDPLWFFTESPYSGASDIYGSGALFHFLKGYHEIFGRPLAFAFLGGTLLLLIHFLRSFLREYRKKELHQAAFWSLLVLLPPILIFATHSYLWWQGLKGSLGLYRVMATCTPFLVLGALAAFRLLKGMLQRSPLPPRTLRYAWPAFLLGLVTWAYVEWDANTDTPIPLPAVKKTVKNAGEWYLQNGTKKDVYYLYPYFAFTVNMNPFKDDRAKEFWSLNKKDPSKGLRKGDMIVWDSKFGPNEGDFPLERLKKDERLQLVKTFRPKAEAEVLGGHSFVIHIFKVGPAGSEKEDESENAP